MPVIQRPDLVAKIRKAFDLTGPDAISTVSPELVPVVVIDDLVERRSDPRLYAIGHNAASGAQNNQTQLYNPSGSGVLVVVRRMIASVTGAGIVLLYIDTNAYTTASTGGNRNLGKSGAPVARMRQQSTAVPTGADVGRLQFAAAGSQILDVDYVLPEGQGLGFTHTTAGSRIDTTWMWEEIPSDDVL